MDKCIKYILFVWTDVCTANMRNFMEMVKMQDK
jgi:uncharacterized protein YbdZ (MbtH family)